MAVRVNLLGGFAASVDGEAVPAATWRLKKARELVKLLALAPGHRLHREVVMDVFWRELAPAAAANNLNQVVYVARRALGPEAIELSDEVLSLAADVDVDLLEQAAATARRMRTATAYAAALSFYGGELLPENRYDDWADARRDELTTLAAELAEERSELGASRFVLPADASSFVGRGRELAELEALLRRTRLLTLSGTGGVGKTRLALELARAAEGSYESGAALVELAAVGDGRLVADAVGRALDVRPLAAQDLLEALAQFVASRTLLLVLDNCEHVLSETAALADTLLRAAPNLTILATSREPLRVAGEVVFRVPSLALPNPEQPIDAHHLCAYEAVSLFVERAAAAAPGFVLDDGNAADVARICLRLDGLPLALELAAGRLDALGIAAIAARLDDRFRLLRSGSKAAPTRQQTLAATLEWSYELLEPVERLLFARLAVFSGGFELEAVEEVCAEDGVDPGDVIDMLARLVEKSLVTTDSGERRHRYRLLETVRLYARDRLDESGDLRRIADRHADWALRLAEREHDAARLECEAANLRSALDTLLALDAREALRLCVALTSFWLGRLELDEAKRRFGEALAAAPDPTRLRAAGLLAAAIIEFRSGTLARGIELAEESHAVAVAVGDVPARWCALQFLGESGVASDHAQVAVPWLERALGVARAEGLAPEEALGVHSLGVAAWMLGDLERADRLVAKSIEGFRALEQTDKTISTPLNIADFRADRPDGRSGLELVFEDSLQPFLKITCFAAVSWALANQAAIARARGDFARARALLEESGRRFDQTGDATGCATVLVRRGYLALADGNLGTARECLHAALSLRTRLGDRRGRGLVLAGLGLIETEAGNFDAADRLLSETREVFRRAGDRWGLASALWRTADLAIARDRIDDAETALREALVVLRQTGRERWIANTLTGLAEVALLRGELDSAFALLADAHDRYAMRDDALGIASIEQRLAQLQSNR